MLLLTRTTRRVPKVYIDLTITHKPLSFLEKVLHRLRYLTNYEQYQGCLGILEDWRLVFRTLDPALRDVNYNPTGAARYGVLELGQRYASEDAYGAIYEVVLGCERYTECVGTEYAHPHRADVELKKNVFYIPNSRCNVYNGESFDVLCGPKAIDILRSSDMQEAIKNAVVAKCQTYGDGTDRLFATLTKGDDACSWRFIVKDRGATTT